MAEGESHGGLLGSLRRMVATLLEMGQVRLQILGNELEQEKLRIFDALLLAGVGLVLVSVGTLLLCIFIVMLFAEGYRLAAIGLMTVAFIAGGILALRASGHRLRGPGHMFQATLGELAQDQAALVRREP